MATDFDLLVFFLCSLVMIQSCSRKLIIETISTRESHLYACMKQSSSTKESTMCSIERVITKSKQQILIFRLRSLVRLFDARRSNLWILIVKSPKKIKEMTSCRIEMTNNPTCNLFICIYQYKKKIQQNWALLSNLCT